MSLKYVSSLGTIGFIAIAATSAMAGTGVSNNANFACLTENDIAVTVSQSNGEIKPIFRWEGDLLDSLNANPTELCQDAAIRLNEYVTEKYGGVTANSSSSQMFSFISGQQLGLPAVCATDDPELGCEAVLFTLSPTDKPIRTANHLLTAILEKDLQSHKTELESPARGVQSISYSISILDLIFGSKYLK